MTSPSSYTLITVALFKLGCRKNKLERLQPLTSCWFISDFYAVRGCVRVKEEVLMG